MTSQQLDLLDIVIGKLRSDQSHIFGIPRKIKGVETGKIIFAPLLHGVFIQVDHIEIPGKNARNIGVDDLPDLRSEIDGPSLIGDPAENLSPQIHHLFFKKLCQFHTVIIVRIENRKEMKIPLFHSITGNRPGLSFIGHGIPEDLPPQLPDPFR